MKTALTRKVSAVSFCTGSCRPSPDKEILRKKAVTLPSQFE